MGNPVVWFEIYVQDMSRAKAFYEAVFGLPLSKLESPNADMDMEMWAFPMAPEGGFGATGTLVQMKGVPSGGNSTMVYFSSPDCAVEAGKAVAAGGKVTQPKMSIGPYGHIALLVDTEGNMIGVHSMA